MIPPRLLFAVVTVVIVGFLVPLLDAATATPPRITRQPVSKTVVAGAVVTFSVGASGTPTLTYQWYKDGEPIDGATAASYSTGKTTADSAGYYSVVVTNDVGSATSDEAELVINLPPVITLQPIAQTVTYGDPVSFYVEADGSDTLAFQWRRNNTSIPDATDSAFALDPATFADAGDYTVVVTNAYGKATSVVAKLVVNVPAPPFSPPEQGIPAGTDVSLDLSGGEPIEGVRYFVTGLPAGLSLNADTGEITGSITAPTGTYTLTFWAQYGTLQSPLTTVPLLVVASPPEIVAQPEARAVVAGASVTFAVEAIGTPTLTYQWFKDGEPIASATNATYEIEKTTADSAGVYTVVVTNEADSVTSDEAELIVNLPPVITSPPVAQAVTYGEPATFSVEADGTETLAYQWRKNDVDLPGANGATLTLDAVTFTDAGDYTVVVTNDYGTDVSVAAKLVVDVPAPPFAFPAEGVPAGPSVSLDLTGGLSIPGLQYFATGLPAGLSLNADTGEIAGSITAPTGIYAVTFWAQYGALKGPVSAVQLVVVPTPPEIVTQPEARAVVGGASVTFTVEATGTPTLLYQWFKDGEPIASANKATYEIEKTTADSAGVYTVVVTNEADSVTSDDAELIVNLPPVITSQPLAQTVTYGEPVTLSVEAEGTETLSYQWRLDDRDLPESTDADLVIDPATFADAGNYTVVVTNDYGTVTSAVAKLTVAVPAPSLAFPEDGVPVGGPVALDLSGGEPIDGVRYFATGLPAGLSIDPVTGQIAGTITAKPGTYTVTFWAQYGDLKSTIATTQITVTAFPTVFVGSFEGLLLDDEQLPVGKVSLTVTAAGAFSGKLTTADPKAYSFNGTELALDEDYATASTPVLTLSRGPGLAPYFLALTVSTDGTLAAVLADLGSTESGVKLAVFGKKQTSPWAGGYTLALSDPVNSDETAAPEGDGYALAKISAAGVLSIKGKLADGTKFTGSFLASVDGGYVWYLKPHKISGNYLAGVLALTERSDETGRYEALASDFAWKKPASPKDKVYPLGFGPVSLTVEMQKWIAPVFTKRADTTITLAARLGLDESDPSGSSLGLLVDGAGLPGDDVDYGLPTTLLLGRKGAVVVADETNPTKWSIKLNPKTGAFSGGFSLKDGSTTRKVSFEGVLLQPSPDSGSSALGRGFFLLKPLVRNEPTLSGAVELLAP